MLVVFAGNWWLLALRGAIALTFGVTAFLWLGVGLTALAPPFAAYALLDVALSLLSAHAWEPAGSAPRLIEWSELLRGQLVLSALSTIDKLTEEEHHD